jgi:aliphatic nitrilase
VVSYNSKFLAATVQARAGMAEPQANDRQVDRHHRSCPKRRSLIAFPEVFVPGCPYWAWLGVKYSLSFTSRYHGKFVGAGDDRASPPAGRAPQPNHSSWAIRSGKPDRAYLSQVFIDERGEIVANRRKLKPTHVERTILAKATEPISSRTTSRSDASVDELLGTFPTAQQVHDVQPR